MTLTHRERLQACLNGEATDRPPVALWRHYPIDDQAPETQAAATLNFQKTYDFDMVKVTPASSFCLRDWGVEDVWEGNTEGTRRYTKRVIQEPGDWEKLPTLDSSAPHLAAQLACLRQIRAGLGPDTPMLQTVFSPLAQAKNLVGGAELIAHIRLITSPLNLPASCGATCCICMAVMSILRSLRNSTSLSSTGMTANIHPRSRRHKMRMQGLCVAA